MPQKRRFERFTISEDAVASDEHGRVLGKVIVAGGGGMGIRLADRLKTGELVQVTIVEPKSGARHTIDVIVRYVHQGTAGVEFVTGHQVRARKRS